MVPLVERTFAAFGMEKPLEIENLFVREEGGVRLTIAAPSVRDILNYSHTTEKKLRVRTTLNDVMTAHENA